MKRDTKGRINALVGAVSYGANPLFALPLFAGGIEVNSVLFYRYFFAVMIYGVWIKFFKKISLKISIKEFCVLFILGLLFSFSSLTLFWAFNYIEAGIACTILFIYPVMVAIIMALFFGEKITKGIVFSILLTSIGISLLYKGKAGAVLNLYGVILVLSASLFYALYMVGIKTIGAVKHMKSEKLSCYVMLFGLLVYVFNLRFCTQLQILDGPMMLFFALALAIFPTIVSFETTIIAIKLIGSTTTAILGALEPITALFCGIVFFGEHLTPKIILGVLLILIGVSIVILRSKNPSIKGFKTHRNVLSK